MFVTLFGIVTPLNGQPSPKNAFSPMLATTLPPSDGGIFTYPLGRGEMAQEFSPA
jgi:hypothetical protein